MASDSSSILSPSTLEEHNALEALVDGSVTAVLGKLHISENSASTQSEIDETIANLDVVLSKYADSIRNRQIGLRRRRNREAPINRLPHEVFIHIIFLAVGGWEDWDIWLVLRAMMVCRTWRDAIHPEPTLWCHLSSYQERWQNQLVLRCNPSAPLSVSSTSKHWLQNNLQASNPSRWRGFLYKGQLFPALLEALQSAKRLRNLSISADSRSAYSDIPQVTIPNPVDLLTLDLQFVTLPWSFLQGVRLEVLSLQGLRKNGPSTSEILSILSDSPNLRRLILQLLDSDDEADATFDERPPHTAHSDRIHLPELKTVSIRSVPKTLSHAILGRLDAPLCEAMDVLDCNSSHFDPSSKSPLPTTIKPILQAARRVVISYSAPSPAEGRAMGIETTDPEVRIRDIARPAVTESPGLNLFVWLHDERDWSYVIQSLDLRSLPNSLTLRFTCSSVEPMEGGESSVPLLLVGDISPSVDCLDFDGAFDPIPVLRYLSNPQPDRNGRNHWPCPRLKTIAISGRVPWPQASTDELEKQCINFLQRSSKSVDGLAPPEQVEKMVVHRGDIQHHLYHMTEFRSVGFFSVRRW